MSNRMIRGRADVVIDIAVYIIMILMAIIFLYPVIYTIANSFSGADAVLRREVWLWPVDFSLRSYELVMEHQYVLPAYWNTIVYTVLGTAYSLVLTVLGAYPLSRSYLPFRNFIMLLIAFTMMFSGGLIPTYLLVRDLGLVNKIWALILPCAVTPFNLILLRTSMQEIPDAIEESAKIDGANDWIILIRIILPMCMASLMTITLLYFVAKWNDWFNALIYLNDRSMYPVQLILREILVNNEDKMLNQALLRDSKNSVSSLGFKCAIMVIAMAPLIIIYPFVQRFFVKGILIGAVKG
mgnify:CR=1 FL=1